MGVIILGGIGNGDWLPILWVLLGIAAVIQIADWGIKYLRKRKVRGYIRQDIKHIDDDTSFFSDN